MKRRWFALLVLLIAQHGLFVTLAVWLAPIQGPSAAVFLVWMVLPAFTAAIACSAVRRPIIAAAVNGVVAATLLDYLLLVHGYFWPDRPDIAPILAVIYQVLAIVISSGCGAFVHVITTAIENQPATTTKQRMTIAAKKGFAFSSVCVAASLPVLWLLLPPHTSPHHLTIFLVYSLAGIAGGVLVASAVGTLYTVPAGWH